MVARLNVEWPNIKRPIVKRLGIENYSIERLNIERFYNTGPDSPLLGPWFRPLGASLGRVGLLQMPVAVRRPSAFSLFSKCVFYVCSTRFLCSKALRVFIVITNPSYGTTVAYNVDRGSAGWPDWANFRPWANSFILGIFLKITQIVWLHTWATFWAIFLTKTSGHPVERILEAILR
jgi:hypothetical protein